MKLRFDIKTVSEANQAEHWSRKHRRKKDQQNDFAMLWRQHQRTLLLPLTVTFTRYSCKVLDTDNLAGAFKHIQDELARQLGVDDGDGSVQWKYEQVRLAKREHYFEVEFSNESTTTL